MLKTRFSHCYVVRKESERAWVVIDAKTTYLKVQVLHTDKFVPEYLFKTRGHRYVRVPQCRRNLQYVHVFNCVSLVKYFLGIAKWNIFTPWQLYQYLEKRYGRWQW